jgi:hypothetical protein
MGEQTINMQPDYCYSGRGRQKNTISAEQLKFLIGLKFSVTDISKMLNVSNFSKAIRV